MVEAKEAEIQSWIKYHAVEAALREDYNPADVMRLRWVLSFKACGKAKARLVVIGYQDPRLDEGIVKSAPVISRRGRQVFMVAAAHHEWQIHKGDVKAAFLQGDIEGEDKGEGDQKKDVERHLVCDPVPEMAAALGLEHYQLVRLVKSAYGLVDAPRAWWKRLTTDLRRLNWQVCETEPCLLRLYGTNGELIGICCFHVDDVLIAGGGDEYEANLDEVRNLYDWGLWEAGDFIQCGTRVRQTNSKEIFLDQAEYVRGLEPLHVEQRWRDNPDEELDARGTTLVKAKIGELQWFATQCGLTILASLSLAHSFGATPCGRDVLEINKVVRTAHVVAADGIRIPKLQSVSFACWADASWANRRDLSSTCGYVVAAVENQFLKNDASPVAIVSWYSKKCPRMARSSGAAEIQAASEGQEELEYCRLLWAEIHCSEFSVRQSQEHIRSVPGVLLIDAKGIYDALARSESAALAMKDKRSAIEGLALRNSIMETQTGLRWCHSGVNISDAMTKGGNGPLELLRKFVTADSWKIVYDPDFTSFRKLKEQKRV